MKLIKKEYYGIQQTFNTNVETVHNYITEGGLINHNCVIDERISRRSSPQCCKYRNKSCQTEGRNETRPGNIASGELCRSR